MLVAAPFRWADPATWPLVVWAWVVLLLVGWGKPAWQWSQRRQANAWPTLTGCIEAVAVKPKKQILIPTAPGGRAAAYMAELAYSYTLEGNCYLGQYRREFPSEEEGREFVRDLHGKSVIVSYNARKPGKSLLSEEAVSTLLDSRPPTPGGAFQAPVSSVPEWVKPLLWPVIFLSAIGFCLSLWVQLGALMGKRVVPEPFFWGLHIGIFVVWFPAVFVAQRRVGNVNRKDIWKAVLRGCPDWLRWLFYGSCGYAGVTELIFFFQAQQARGGTTPPLADWRGISVTWMAFYSAALAILYSAASAPEDQV